MFKRLNKDNLPAYGDYILVVSNMYSHKSIAETVMYGGFDDKVNEHIFIQDDGGYWYMNEEQMSKFLWINNKQFVYTVFDQFNSKSLTCVYDSALYKSQKEIYDTKISEQNWREFKPGDMK